MIGSALVTLSPGIFVTCFLLARTTPWLMNVGVAGGAICVIAGPIVAISGLARGFGDDVFLSARTDGVTVDRNGKAQGLTWEEVEAVAFEAPGSLVFRLRDGEPLVIPDRWDGVTTEDLARQLEDLRRKASFNLLANLRPNLPPKKGV